MRRFTPETNPLKLKTESSVPFAAELDETAQLIVEDTTTSILDGKMSGIEAAGRFSLSALLSAVASGKISLRDSFTFLKTIAEKKTPDPVMHVEQHQTIDLRGIIVSAVQANPDALQNTVALALVARQQIQEKLDAMDGSLQLRAADPGVSLPERVRWLESDPESPASLATEEQDRGTLQGWQPGEPPPEIKLLKREVI